MSWLLELRDLRLWLGRHEILQGASLQLANGEWIGLVGSNGSGKSTLIKAIAGLQALESGEVLVDGQPVVDWRNWRRQLGIVAQQSTFWRGSVRDNLAYPLRVHRLGLDRLDQWLDRLELGFFANYPAEALSVGEAQRLAIGRALIAAPRVLLLDDPTAGCDLQSAKLVETLVGEFHGQGGTVVWATPARGALPPQTQTVHYLYEGSLSCDPPSVQLFSDWE